MMHSHCSSKLLLSTHISCFEFTEKQNKYTYLDKCCYVNHQGLCSCYNKLVHASNSMRSAKNLQNISNPSQSCECTRLIYFMW